MKTKRYLLILLTLFCFLGSVTAQNCSVEEEVGNLVVNGGFEQGKVGFETEYFNFEEGGNPAHNLCIRGSDCDPPTFLIACPTGTCYRNWSMPREFLIGNDPDIFNPGAFLGGPQAGSNFLMVDGACDVDMIAWSQTVTVEAGKVYYFSSYISSIKTETDQSAARLNFTIIKPGQPRLKIGDLDAPLAVNTWVNFEEQWVSDYTGEITIAIINENVQDCGNGNDFGLDEIKFIPDCDLAGIGDEPYLEEVISLCNGNITLDPVLPKADSEYEFNWSTGATTPALTNISTAGKYSVCVRTRMPGGAWSCPSSTIVTVVDTFDVDLGPDRYLCESTSVTLQVDRPDLNITGYSWTGTTGSSSSVSVSEGGTICVTPTVPNCNEPNTTNNCVNVIDLLIPPVPPLEVCPGDPVVLDPNAGFPEYEWYDSQTGGRLLHVGPTFPIDAMPEGDTTLYVQVSDHDRYSAGPPLSQATGTNYWNFQPDREMNFRVHSEMRFDQLTIPVNFTDLSTVKSGTVSIYDLNNNLIWSSGLITLSPIDFGTITPIYGQYILPIYETLQPGSYKLVGDGTITALVNQTPTGFPFTSPATGDPLIELLPDNNTGDDVFFFFDWDVSVGPNCIRTPVTALADCPCNTPDDVSITASPDAAVQDTVRLCEGETSILQTSQSNSTLFAFVWYKDGFPGGTVVQPSQDGATSSYSVTYANANAWYYVVAYDKAEDINTTACKKVDSIYVKAVLPPLAEIDLTDLEYCADEAGITLYAADAGPGAEYEWSRAGTVIQPLGSRDSLENATAGSYTVRVVKEGCEEISDPVQVIEHVEPIAAIAGPVEYCQGTGGVTLTGAPAGMTSYEWLKDASSVGTANTLPNALFGSYHLEVVDANSCVDTSDIHIIIELPLPSGTPVINGPDELCFGSAGVEYSLTGSVNDVTDYIWTLPSGVSFSAGTDTSGLATTSIIVDFNNSTSATIKVTPINNCGPGAEVDHPVTIFQPVTVHAISGNHEICENGIPDLLQLTTNPGGGNPVGFTWQWQESSDGSADSWSDISGATSEDYQSSELVITKFFRSIAMNQCDTVYSDPVEVTVIPNETPEVTITPTAGSDCAGQTINFNVDTKMSEGDNPSFRWEVNQLDVTNVSESFSSSSLTDGSEVCVIMTSSLLCVTKSGDTACAPVTIVDNVVPAVYLTISEDTICDGESVTVTATGAGTGDNPVYEWDLDGDGTYETTTDKDMVTHTISPSVGGSIKVRMTSDSPCRIADFAEDDTLLVVDLNPVQPFISEPDTIHTCADQVTLNVTSPDPSTSTAGWAITEGQGTVVSPSSATSTISDLLMPGLTKVIWTIENGICPPKKDSVYIDKKGSLTTPLISIDGGEFNDFDVTDGSVTVCITGNYTLTGAPVQPGETGSWSLSPVSGGSVSISDPVINNVQPINLDIAGSTTLSWTISSDVPGCDPLVHSVEILVDAEVVQPVVSNPDTIHTCADQVTLDVSALDPSTSTGLWTIESGQGSVTSASSTTTILGGLVDIGITKVIWETVNGLCPPKKDSVYVKKYGNLTTPILTLDGDEYDNLNVTDSSATLCITGNYTLTGAPVAGGESGQWTITPSSGGSISIGTDMTANVHPLILNNDGVTTLTWTISTTIDGCEPEARSVDLTVTPLPGQPDPIQGEDTLCVNSSSTYTSSPSTTGVTDSLHWELIPPSAGSIESGQGTENVSINYTVSGPVTVRVTPWNQCGSGPFREYQIEVLPAVVPLVTISPADPICAGQPSTWVIIDTAFGGQNPGFEWYINNDSNPVGTSSDSITYTGFNDGDQIYVKMISTERCVDPTVVDVNGAVESNKENQSVIALQPVTVTVNPDKAEYCQGEPVVLTAVSAQPLSSIEWFVGTDPVVQHTSLTWTVDSLQHGDIVRVRYYANLQCPNPHPAVADTQLVIIDVETPVVAIQNPDVEACEETNPGTFTAVSQYGGADPEYRWYVDGVEVATDIESYTPPATYSPGTYPVIIEMTSSYKCPQPEIVSDTAFLIIHPNPDTTVTGALNFCPGESTVLHAVSGYAQYQWYGTSGPLPNEIFEDIIVGYDDDISVEITTDEGCILQSQPKQVRELQLAALMITSTEGDTICDSETTTLTVTMNGQTIQADSLVWHRDGILLPGKTQGIVVADSGSYVVTMYFGSCEKQTDFDLNVIPTPDPVIIPGDTLICGTETLTILVDNAVGSLTWYHNGEEMTNVNGQSFVTNEPGQYTVLEDVKFCSTLSPVMTLQVDDPVYANAGPDKATQAFQPVQLEGSGGWHYLWTGADSLFLSNFYVPMPNVVPDDQKELLEYYLTVTSENHVCMDVDTVLVRVEAPIDPWNSLTPNLDGSNDYWRIYNIESFPNARVEVYNRWGNLVWLKEGGYKNDHLSAWQGENFRNGLQLPMATYYYIIHPNGDAIKEPVTGHVTILK